MNTTRTGFARSLGLALVALALLTGTMAAQAQKSKAPQQTAGNFKGAAAIWKRVEAKAKALDQTIHAKKLKVVHEAAFAVRDQVQLLPAKSKGLSADAQQKLAKGVETIKHLAGDMDEAGDGGKQAEVDELHKKLDTVLAAIKALYPAGALK